ncbi:hypothetical protein COU75_01290 [Candidatus Peregrinibacteria bacterium CG10_big_fil_rev_8_21_14_0_10_42_8]|nr:MAG: hypothetical protein COU75_01290 [Candidatus Peregrinibacteria bacterium CG10_big_fil_rev_8_21_14_0_10_42_8]
MRSIIRYIDRFFFAETNAAAFGLMRIAWAATVLAFLFGSAPDVMRYYSEAGILPAELGHLVFRNEYRYSLLLYITEPHAVIALWSIFVVCLICMMIGIWPRLMTITSVLLLFSFHERNLQPLGGGDTVLRNIGFLLMIAPEISAFSIARLEKQWLSWKSTGEYLKPLRTHIWPYRLLLWQVIIIYVTSAWDKTQGTMWSAGTVVEAAFHHTHFARWSKDFMDSVSWISPYACFYTIIWEFSWLLLLVPRELWMVRPRWMHRFSLRRWIILGGVIFHWGIFVFMDVGSFPFAMSTAFLGLLLDEDFEMFIRVLNKRFTGKIVVLYDGQCHLCQRSVFILQLLDQLHRLEIVNFRDPKQRKKYAAKITEDDLDRAMHIKLPDGTYYKGFFAFRKIAWHLPITRFFTPLFYIPGMPFVGKRIYARIAERRKKCRDDGCVI